jgi:DNA-binding CsgD family transcriptional regulator
LSDLGQLYFGRDDAESDIAEGGLLHAGFLRTAAFRAVESGRKQLVIGRKGSGKSAICVTLAAANDAVSLITPDEISADEIQRFELAGINIQQSKTIIWRYILMIQVAKFIVVHAREHDKQPAAVEALRKFLLANGEAADHRWHEKFWKVIQRLRASLSLEAFGAKVAFDAGPTPSEGVRASGQLEVVEKQILRALAELKCPASHRRPLLLVDQMEKVWSNDSDSEAMVAGLLQAAKNVHARLPGVRCVVFLRADIYDILQFPDKDKLHGDEMRIDWTPEGLSNLALVRARASLGRDVANIELFGQLFPEKINGTPTDEYIINLTLLRPRDMIQFCNLCRDTAEKNGHAAVIASDVVEAEVQYSLWKLQDLANEYLVNYPFLGELFVLFQNSGYLVSRKEVEDRVASLQHTLLRRYPDYFDAIRAPRVIDILFGIGFLGVRRNHRFEYAYLTEKPVEMHDTEFCVHPGFREALRATTAANIHPYSPSESVNAAMLPAGIVALMSHGGRLPRSYGDADLQLIASIVGTADTILRQLGRPGIPPELAAEIREHLLKMRDDADMWLTEFADVPERVNPQSIEAHVKRTAAYLDRLGDDLERMAESSAALRPLVQVVRNSARQVAFAPLADLTGRELEIARLSVTGASVREIARVLRYSPSTVENHLRRIYRKLGIGSRSELAAILRQAE